MHLVVVGGHSRLAPRVKDRFDGKSLGLTETMLLDAEGAEARAVDVGPSVLLLAVSDLDAEVLSLCRRLGSRRASGATPLVVVAERASELERIAALDAGADHVVSPFDLDAVEWGLAVLCQHRVGQRPLHGQGIAVPATGSTITVSGVAVRLTMREAAVLRALLRHRDAVVRRGELESGIWGRIKSRTLDVHIARLRNKLGPLGCRIETVPRVGYRYRDSSSLTSSARRSELPGT